MPVAQVQVFFSSFLLKARFLFFVSRSFPHVWSWSHHTT
ncbi:unnamed protein product [Ixodes pacificus]